MNGLHAAATGRITSEVDERFTQGGKRFASFSILVDVAHSVATEAKAAPEPTWLRVTAWEPSDELLAGLRKGASVYVEGRLTLNQWTAIDGAPRSGLNLSAWRCDVHAAIGKNAPRREAITA